MKADALKKIAGVKDGDVSVKHIAKVLQLGLSHPITIVPVRPLSSVRATTPKTFVMAVDFKQQPWEISADLPKWTVLASRGNGTIMEIAATDGKGDMRYTYARVKGHDRNVYVISQQLLDEEMGSELKPLAGRLLTGLATATKIYFTKRGPSTKLADTSMPVVYLGQHIGDNLTIRAMEPPNAAFLLFDPNKVEYVYEDETINHWIQASIYCYTCGKSLSHHTNESPGEVGHTAFCSKKCMQ